MQLRMVIGKPSMEMQDARKAVDLGLRHCRSGVTGNALMMLIPPGPLEKGVKVGCEQTRSAFVVARELEQR
jgi:hypothetical protein